MARNTFQLDTGELLGVMLGAYVPHEPVDIDCSHDGMTKAEFADECDINALMARYEKTGMLPQNPEAKAFYGDFADLPSYQEAQNLIMSANSAFMELPARVRAEFDNDPARFVEFAEDPANIDHMRQWGLAEPLDPPSAVEPASPASAVPDASGASESAV